MTVDVVNDWVIRVGMDTSQVRKGTKEILTPLKQANKKIEDSLKRQNALESKRLQLLRAIERARGIGLKTQGFTQSLRGGKIPQLEKRRLELEKLITLERKKQKEVATKQAAKDLIARQSAIEARQAARQSAIEAKQAAAKVKKQPSAFGLADERQLKLANSIDTVMRKAGRTIGVNSEEFRKLNSRAQELKSTISSISSRTGLERLNNQIVRLRENVNSASSAMRSQKSVGQSLTASMNNLATSYLSVFAAIEGGRAILQTGSKFDSLSASLLAASGGVEAAARDFEFIKGISNEMGISLLVVADGYRQIGAAARASGSSSEVMNKQFRQMTKLSRAFGLTAADSSLVMLAFQQMISKGVVSSEELRRQLGERLFGAVPQAAKALGVTTLELDKMLRSGQVVTTEFLPKFLDQMESFVDESGAYEASLKTITAANQRFTSSIQLGIIDSFDAGLKSGLVGFLDRLTENITQLTPIFKIFGSVVGTGLSVITATLDILSPILEIVSQSLAGLVQIFEEAFNLEKSSENISALSVAMRVLAGSLLFLVGHIQGFLGWLQALINGSEKLEGVWKLLRQVIGVFAGGGLILAFLRPIKTLKMLGSIISGVIKSVLRLLGLMDKVDGKGGKPSKPGKPGSKRGATRITRGAPPPTSLKTKAITGAKFAAKGLSRLAGPLAAFSLIEEAASSNIVQGATRVFSSDAREKFARELEANPHLRKREASTVTTTNEITINLEAPSADAREVSVMVAEEVRDVLSANNASLATV
jgi:tape measure domain-containing protein